MSFTTLKRALVAGVFAVTTVAFATPAKAATVIDFSGNIAGGLMATLSTGDVVGIDIPINALNVLINGVQITNPPVPVSGTCGPSNNLGCLNFNTLTNTISITGLGLTLLDGSFAPGTGLPNGFSFTNLGGVGSFMGTGPDHKAPQLLAAIGLPADTQFAFFGFSIGANVTGLDACNRIQAAAPVVTGCFIPFSTDISNTAVPEPGSMMLLGTGLLGLGNVIRRRFGR